MPIKRDQKVIDDLKKRGFGQTPDYWSKIMPKLYPNVTYPPPSDRVDLTDSTLLPGDESPKTPPAPPSVKKP